MVYSADKIIEVKDLTVGYEDDIILSNMNFHIYKGEIFAILGSSGVGKSTILKNMIGLIKPISGSVFIKGVDITSVNDENYVKLTKEFGVLYQSGALFSSMNLIENVSMPMIEYTDYSNELIHSIAKVKLAMVGLAGFEEYMPYEISGGMKKRAAIARALALDPEILFFDEPSAGLDPISSANFDNLILELKAKLGVTIVIVTHDLECLFHVADRIIFLDSSSKGIIAEGNPHILRESSDKEYVRNFLNRKYL